MSVNYVYEQIVSKGALAHMLTDPAVRNTLEDRVQIALRSLQSTELHMPKDLQAQMKAEFDKIRAVYHHETSSRNQSPVIEPIRAKIRSLSPTKKREVLRAYLAIAVEVIKRYGAEEERRRHPRPKIMH